MIELTATDHQEIDRLRGMANEDDDERVLLHAIYRAGLAAGITALRERIAALEAERDALRLVVTAAQEMREECRFVSAGPLYDSVFAFDASLAAPEGFGEIDTRDGFGLAGISYAEQLAERYPVILSLLNATPSSNKNWPGNLVAEAIALFAEYEHLTSTLDRRYGQTVNDGV